VLVDVDNGGGGSVTVAEVLVATPVPGPVIPSDGLGLNVVEVVLCGGSRMLERPELISLNRELSGVGGSDVLELVVTIPVGASKIPDVLDVGTGGSTDVDDSCWAAELLVDEGRSTAVLVRLPRTGGSTVEEGSSESLVEEDSSGFLVEDSVDELSAAELVLSGVVSVEEEPADELWPVEVLPSEVSVDEGLSDALSLAELLADELPRVLLSEELAEELSLEDGPSDALLDELSEELSDVLELVEDESGEGVGNGGVT